jgi:ectoine hydroxylase-related dioxygenase (phytanoyl-CoA dioxygenase family)
VAVKEWLGEDGIFQLSPTIRFYFPHAEGFNWRLNYHTDIMLGHPPQEINIWIPLTRVYGSNSMRLMPLEPSLAILRRYDFDFKAYAEAVQTSDALQDELNDLSFVIEGELGEAVLFDSRCLHVLQNNQTEHSRASMDLRVMPHREYQALDMKYVGTGRRLMPFTTGQYYSSEIVTV